jgi:hypothetical protein
MGVNSVPLRWPAAWKDPGMLSLLQATPIRHLIMEHGPADQAKRAGFAVVDLQKPPADIAVIKGPWPGIRMSRSGGDHASAGPTGEPWVDSNGWRIKVARAQRPDAQLWVDSPPQPSRSSAADYIVAFADAAAHGARWIITLDDTLASGIKDKKPDAMETWQRIASAAAFFAQDPGSYDDASVIGVLSSFAGPKLAFTGEVINNLARTKQQYRALAVNRFNAASLAGLKGVIYTDSAEVPSNISRPVMDFVNAGGILITSPAWGSLPNGAALPATHPRFAVRTLGKGAIAVANAPFSDPYRVPNDAVVLVSHRNDIVRFFNSGAITPCLYGSADKRRAVLHTVFYSLRPVDDTSVWVRGAYKSARLRTWSQPQPQNVKLEARDAGVEVHLPAVAQYAMIELEA